MTAIARTRPAVWAVVLCLSGATLATAQPRAADNAMHDHGGHESAATQPVTDGLSDPLTINVALSDTELRPSAVFVPAGRSVQLMLRNRGSVEHHYHVVGLEPDVLFWVSRPEPPADAGVGDEHSGHHGLQLRRSRAPSPAGIRPTGDAVHAYVTVPGDVDAVLFTARQTGTFVVQCDLHREQLGTLTVFDDAGSPSAAAAAPPSRQMLARLLTKDLGSVDAAGVSGIQVEATYATAEYAAQALGGAAAVASLAPDRHVTFLLTERTHTTNLPAHVDPPQAAVNGRAIAFVDRRVMTDSPHHRATLYRFARDETFGDGHQMLTLRLSGGQEATWHLPIVVADVAAAAAGTSGLGEQWGLVIALLGGMLAAMWPCLFQLTVYFIPALAGVAMQDEGGSASVQRRRVLVAAFYFILGFTLVYTLTGAAIGFAAQRLGGTDEFETWQRYFGMAAGVVVIGLALRVAAKARAPLVCRMPLLSRMTRSGRPATRIEMMLAGLAFATGCMTCFGSALVVGMVVYVGLAQSALYGALVLFLFSLGMGIPLVLAALAMARALPLLMKLEGAVPWMGLASAALMTAFGVLLLSGNYMMVSEWTFRVVNGSALTGVGRDASLAGAAAIAITAGFAAWLIWRLRASTLRS